MKRLTFVLIALIALLAVFGTAVYADDTSVGEVIEETSTPETVTDTPETSVELQESEGDEIIDKVIAVVTDGEIWAKIGVSLAAVIALLATIKVNLNKFTDIIGALKSLVAGKATKEETEKVISDAIGEMKTEYSAKLAEINAKNDELCAKNDKLTAILSIISLQLLKSPNARTSVMALLQSAEDEIANVGELVEKIEAEIEAADAETPKPETPALDQIKESVSEPSEEINIVLE